MTKYLWHSPGNTARILFVRRWRPDSRWWAVCYTPYSWVTKEESGGRRFIELDLDRSAEAMQRKLDAYAKKFGLAVWEEGEKRS